MGEGYMHVEVDWVVVKWYVRYENVLKHSFGVWASLEINHNYVKSLDLDFGFISLSSILVTCDLVILCISFKFKSCYSNTCVSTGTDQPIGDIIIK